MKRRKLIGLLAVLTLVTVFFMTSGIVAQKATYTPDKELCARMMAAGKEYYVRGKYLDAKNYFRKAVEADPRSQKAWRYYDQAVIFALAEKVEKKNDFLVPDVSIRSEGGAAVSHEATAVVTPIVPDQPMEESEEDEPFEEEGC